MQRKSASRRDLILVALSGVLATSGQHLDFTIPTYHLDSY